MPALELDLGKVVITPYEAAQEAGYTGTEEAFNAALNSLNGAPFLPLSGGTMTGALHAPIVTGLSAPVATTDSARKGYVDGLVGSINDELDAINGEVI